MNVIHYCMFRGWVLKTVQQEAGAYIVLFNRAHAGMRYVTMPCATGKEARRLARLTIERALS